MSLLVVSSKIKEVVKAAELRVSKEYIEALSEYVFDTVIKSVQKAKESKVLTLKKKHLI